MKLDMALQTITYRLGQVRQQLGFVSPLSLSEYAEVQHWLPASALPLFKTMSDADQHHSLRVCQGLLARGCTETDMLTAALLHDVGKAQGRVPFWTRPAIVLGKLCFPSLLNRLVLWPGLFMDSPLANSGAKQPSRVKRIPKWRRSLSYAWWHAEVGAELAAAVGISERAVLYIRTHHQPHGPAAQLHSVDEVS